MKTRHAIENAVAMARRSVEGATQDLTEARVHFAAAENEYIDGGKRAQLEKKRDAADALDRAETLHRRADDRLQAALVELAQLDREDAMTELGKLLEKLASHERTVEQAAAEFVALDRAVNDQVFAMATVVRDVADTYDRASQLAHELRTAGPKTARPDLASASLTVRRAVTAARAAEDRDALAPHWLSDAPDARDWRLRGMTAADVDAMDRGAAAARRRAAEERNAEEFVAGRVFQATKPETSEEGGNASVSPYGPLTFQAMKPATSEEAKS